MATVVNVNNVQVSEDELEKINALPLTKGTYIDNSHLMNKEKIADLVKRNSKG